MNKTNLLIDLGIFTAFMVAMQPTMTGIALHEWFSVAFAATILIHLLLHWKWIVTVGGQFFRKLFHTSRLKFAVDSLLFIAFTAVMMSGLMISRNVMAALGISLPGGPAWRTIHSLSANGTLVLVGLHFALSWNWVVAMVKRYIVQPLLPARKTAPQPLQTVEK